LDEALRQSLTIIIAPAGSGKTVLLAQWAAAHRELAFAWVSVDAGDDDAVRFARRLLGELGHIKPDLSNLQSEIFLGGEQLGLPFLEALADQMAELSEVIIILDDLQHLSNAQLIADLGRLVELLPANVHLVLSTRVDLPIAWSRRRLRHNPVELRQSDLAFDDAESADLLEHITGRRLANDSVTALVNRTEGWAAGLQFAGVTLRLHDDSDAFISQFQGSDRLVADYLSSEVLRAQPEARRDFLLRVSVLDEMCAELAGLITGEHHPQLVLDQLERDSMFLVPLDSHREWFRFHHLFRDLLRFQLRAQHPGVERQLLQSAAAWHLGRGEVNPAAEYLLRAQDWEGVLELILSRGSDVYEKGEMATVIRWISEIPVTVRAGRHDVDLLLGALLVTDGQAAVAEDTLRRVLTHPTSSSGDRACAQTILAALVQWRHNPQVSVMTAERALNDLADADGVEIPMVLNLTDSQSLETIALISGGRAHFLTGDFDEARAWLRRGLGSAGAAYSVWRVSGLGSLGLLEAWCGNIDFAEELAAEALTIAQETGTLAHPAMADAYLARTLALLERGQPARAALSLHEGTLRAERNRRVQLMWISRLELALLQAASGNSNEATATILDSQSEIGGPPPPVVADRMLALRAHLLRLNGSAERARRFAQDAEALTSATFEGAAAALTLGEVGLARKLVNESPTMLDSTEPLITVERLILSAWASEVEGQEDDAVGHLAEAMVVAEQHSLVEVFLRAGPAIVRLMMGLTDINSGFRNVVLKRAREAMSPSLGNDLPDPLTRRELELLSYLPNRLTHAELAEQCFVSVNTIKTHMARIYRKLDVANRNDAIVRARGLGLI
jgi:LuxR family maltose regulon positive regulatory protein